MRSPPYIKSADLLRYCGDSYGKIRKHPLLCEPCVSDLEPLRLCLLQIRENFTFGCEFAHLKKKKNPSDVVTIAMTGLFNFVWFKSRQSLKRCGQSNASEHRNTPHPLRNAEKTQAMIIDVLHLMAVAQLCHVHEHLRVVKGHIRTIRFAKSCPCAPIALGRGRRGIQTLTCNHGCMLTSEVVFNMKENVFWDTLIEHILFKMMKINNFQGDLSNISATKTSLMPTASSLTLACHGGRGRAQ